MVRIILSTICLVLVFSSCDLYSHTEKKIIKEYTRSGLTLNQLKLSQSTAEYWDNEKNAPVLVVIHGFGASTKYQWRDQLQDLTESHRVIMPNLLHFGHSSTDSALFSIQDQVDFIGELLDSLEIETYSLIGASYGGLVSIETAQQDSANVRSVLLLEPAVKFIQYKDTLEICKKFDVPSMGELFVPSQPAGMSKLIHVANGKKKWVPKFAFKAFHPAFYAYKQSEKRHLVGRLMEDQKIYAKRDYSGIKELTIVCGERDLIIPPERMKMLQDHIGGETRLYIIPKGGHMPNMNKAKEFNKILRNFLLRDIELH